MKMDRISPFVLKLLFWYRKRTDSSDAAMESGYQTVVTQL
jgi:hypothetical protein